MTCIACADSPREKRIVVVLTYIYGIGELTTKRIYANAGIPKDIRSKDLVPRNQGRPRTEADKYRAEGDLRHETSVNIKHLVDIGSYRSVCRHCGFPVRGQNTKNSARTRKGSKRSR